MNITHTEVRDRNYAKNCIAMEVFLLLPWKPLISECFIRMFYYQNLSHLTLQIKDAIASDQQS